MQYATWPKITLTFPFFVAPMDRYYAGKIYDVFSFLTDLDSKLFHGLVLVSFLVLILIDLLYVLLSWTKMPYATFFIL